MSIDAFVWPADFTCTIIDGDLILPNHYSLKFYIEPAIPVNDNIGIGFKKFRHFIDECLSNSVFICKDNPLNQHLEPTVQRLVHFPTEPMDFYLGAVLYAKFIAITEKYFDIYQMTIDSAIGDRIQYTMIDPADSGLDLNGNYWWNRDDLSTRTDQPCAWEELNLVDNPRFMPTIVQGGKSGS